MSAESGSTSVHRGPAQPQGGRGRPVFVAAFPVSGAFDVPASKVVVGRGFLADCDLADREVSGKHLAVERRGGRVRVGDAGSKNGTWVNGAPLAKGDVVALEDRAVVRIGKTLLVYRERFSGALVPAPVRGDLVGPYGLQGVASAIDAIARVQRSAATHALNVLIEGETGVGKELVARDVARVLGRANPWSPVNVAALAEGVFESQLFGHVAGAFSGAGDAAEGLAVRSAGGTLFLDEIGELALPLQAKLLRMLDNREVIPVGGTMARTVDLCVVAATNKNLEAMTQDGSFRADLYARLAMTRLTVPPLRDRPEDLFAVLGHLARRQGHALAPADTEVEAVERLMLEPWPRNVRELDAALAAARRADPEPGLRLWALEDALGPARLPSVVTAEAAEEAIRRAGGNVSAAAKALGISRGKLLRLRKSINDA